MKNLKDLLNFAKEIIKNKGIEANAIFAIIKTISVVASILWSLGCFSGLFFNGAGLSWLNNAFGDVIIGTTFILTLIAYIWTKGIIEAFKLIFNGLKTALSGIGALLAAGFSANLYAGVFVFVVGFNLRFGLVLIAILVSICFPIIPIGISLARKESIYSGNE